MSVDRALEGVAVATALPTAVVMPGKTFAIAGNWGNFEANNAVAFGAAMKLSDNFQINAAVGVGFSGQTSATRVGVNFSW
jgi:hypothetical protein